MPDFIVYDPRKGPVKLMAASSEQAPVKLKMGGVKYRGTIVRTVVDTALTETTMGGLFPGGPPPDPYRSWVPGMRSETLIVEVAGSVSLAKDVRLKIAGAKLRGVITQAVWQDDENIVTITIEIVP